MRLHTTLIAAAALTAASTTRAGIQLTDWTNPGTANWWSAGNWTNGVPTANDWVRIDNGGQAQIAGGITPVIWLCFLGDAPGDFGRLDIRNDAEVFIDVLSIGNDGQGQLTVSGDPHIQGMEFSVGSNVATAAGQATIIGGTINYADFVAAGYFGNGFVQHGGGDVITAEFLVGFRSGSVGNWIMEGGTVTASVAKVGEDGEGTLTIDDDASVDFGQLRIGVGIGTGTVNLKSGSMRVTSITSGTSTGTATFNFTGGQLDVDAVGSSSVAFDLVNNGGDLAPGGAGNYGATHIYGNWTQNVPSFINFQIQSPFVFDRVIVDGDTNLDGFAGISFNLTAPPVHGQTYKIVDNNGPNPINGTFVGFPEGSQVTAFIGSTAYTFVLSYAGGDGNDVVLVACLADGSGDGMVDFDDLNLVLANWGMTGTNVPGDLDGSGTVDFDDLNLVLNTWGTSCT